MVRPTYSGTGSAAACAAPISRSLRAIGSGKGAALPARMSTCSSICSAVAMRPPVSLYISCTMCSRLSSVPSTWIVRSRRSPSRASRRLRRWVSTV